MLAMLAMLIGITPATAGTGLGLEMRGGPVFLEDATALSAGATLIGGRDAYLSAEGRMTADGGWLARAGAGVDLLGGSPVDFKLGLFAGGVGDGPHTAMQDEVVAGGELALGGEVGRLYGQCRWIVGLGTSALGGVHTEKELTVGVRVVAGLRVYGQYLHLDPGARASSNDAVGVGVAWRL